MSHATQRSALTGGTLAILAVLFVAVLVLSNHLFRGARLDLTENDLYTLSDGTREILDSLEEPIQLYFYFSDRTTQELPQLQPLRVYAERVRELLEEIEDEADGKVTLHVVDPQPFSEEEDRAASFGLQATPLGTSGETLFFGLAGSNSTDGQMIIPFFQPDKETLLEYDVAKLIHSLATTTKPAIGLISSLDMGPGFDPASRRMRPAWAVYTSMQELFEVRQLNAEATTSIDPEIRTLVLVHPKAWSEDLLYAIDQFVLGGGNLLVFVDPNAELDTSGNDPSNPTAAMFADKSSNLAGLFGAWGIEYDPGKVLLDGKYALTVGSPNGTPVRHLGILGFNAEALDQDDVVTSQLGSINVATAGVIRSKADAVLALSPLVQASSESMLIDAERIKFTPDPTALFQGFTPTGENYVVAGRLSGKARTAFPARSGDAHRAESEGEVNVIVVADTDVLSDRLWVQVQQFFGQTLMNAFANNGDFVINAVDNLTGSSALISIRGRASSARPFTTVEELRRAADDRLRRKEQELNEELAETEQKLNELQRGKSDENAMILSPEQRAELERFQDEKVRIRKELRQVRRQLDADIEALGTRLKLINIGAVPLLLTVGALAWVGWRRRRRAG